MPANQRAQVMKSIVVAEIFLMMSGAFIGIGLVLGLVAAIAYFLGMLDD